MPLLRRCVPGLWLVAVIHASSVVCSTTTDAGQHSASRETVTADEGEKGVAGESFRRDHAVPTDIGEVAIEEFDLTREISKADTEHSMSTAKSPMHLLLASVLPAILLSLLWLGKQKGERAQHTIERYLGFDSGLRPLGKYEPDLTSLLVAATLTLMITSHFKMYTYWFGSRKRPSMNNYKLGGTPQMVFGGVLAAIAVLKTMLGTTAGEAVVAGSQQLLGHGVGILLAGFAILLYTLYRRRRFLKRLKALGLTGDALEMHSVRRSKGSLVDSAMSDKNNGGST